MIRNLFLLALFFMSLLANGIVEQREKIKTIGFGPHPVVEKHYLPIVKNAYKKIGINLNFIPATDNRSLKMLQQNKLDGLVIRTENILSKHTILINVPPVLGVAEIALVCQDNEPCDENTLHDPKKILGVVGLEAYYKEILKDKNITIYEVSDYKQMESMFNMKKLDAMITVFDLNTQKEKLSKMNSYSLETRNGYHMINKKFKNIIPELSQSLQESIKEHNFKLNN